MGAPAFLPEPRNADSAREVASAEIATVGSASSEGTIELVSELAVVESGCEAEVKRDGIIGSPDCAGRSGGSRF